MSAVLTGLSEVAIFLFTAAGIFFAALLFDRMMLQQKRLGHQGFGGGAFSPSAMDTPLLQQQAPPNALFQWIEESTSISDPQERQRVRRELALAGFENPRAPAWFVILRLGLAIGLPLAFLMYEYLSSKPITGIWLIIWALILCGAGFILPSTFVQRTAGWRRTEIEFEFPDALDLMVVCVEAGLSLDASLVRVGEETRETHPRIARELDKVAEEIRAGRARSEALRTMAERTDVPGIKSFVALVIQTEQLGSSIVQTLRTYSTELRETRFIKAEEKALRIPVLMTVPLVAFILPVIVTALLLPPIIDMIRILFPALLHSGG